jgi:parallel beta-helix repeat protein
MRTHEPANATEHRGGNTALKNLAHSVTPSNPSWMAIAALLGMAICCLGALAQSGTEKNQGATVSGEGRIWVVAQDNSRASDQGPGTAEEPFKTISRAAERAEPGDEVLVHAGVYRERVAPARGGVAGRPIVYMAAPGEAVIVKGSDILRGPFVATEHSASIYMVKLDQDVFHGVNPYATTATISPTDLKFSPNQSLHKTLGQIFVDGARFLEVDDIAQLKSIPSSWLAISGGQSLLIHFPSRGGNPSQHLVEYSVRNRVFAPYKRGLGYITVRGFTFEDCANPRLGDFWRSGGHQDGMVSTRSGHHWIIEENEIRYANSLGLDFGSEGGADQGSTQVSESTVGWDLIWNNTIADNGQSGAAGYGSHFVKIIGNRFERNNILGWPSYEAAGLKTHFFYNGVIEGNLFRDNDCPAIWLDNTYKNDRITRNIILNSTEEGIFVEMGFGPLLIDNNVIAYTRAGDGIYAHDSSGITIAHNLLLANTDWGIRMRVIADRKALVTNGVAPDSNDKAIVETSNERVVGNLLIDNYGGTITLPPHWIRSKNNVSDFNAFATGSQIHWSGVLNPMFAFDNCGGRVSPDEIKQAVFGHLKSLPKNQQPDPALWPDFQLLTLNQWQAISGYEAHSAIAKFKSPSSINTDSFLLTLTAEQFPWKMQHIPAVKGVDRDYFRQPMPQEDSLPGPFQNLHQGENDLMLVQDAVFADER